MVLNPLLAYKAELKQKEFKLISRYINENYGIKLPDHKRIMLQGRLINRLIKLNFSNFKEYTDYVFSEEGKILELPHMIDFISTNKTDFFRESAHFDFLKETVIPEFHAASKYQPMRIWSAACSSGEEAYTIAMAAYDLIPVYSGFDFTILGTDISHRMLEKAQKAIYHSRLIQTIPTETKKKYFLKSKDPGKSEVRVKKELRAKVQFMRHNLMDKEYTIKQEFDVIFCRNVLIYFSKEDQLHVLLNLSKKLKPGAYLFLGHSESITHLNLPLKNVNQTVFQKI
ncbi:MAG: protein-glutamate O-methyltransferase [Bacteroidales bacterium]|nr:protein-glutamate O-methyltransferase [Bacteroidales bacterium]